MDGNPDFSPDPSNFPSKNRLTDATQILDVLGGCSCVSLEEGIQKENLPGDLPGTRIFREVMVEG